MVSIYQLWGIRQHVSIPRRTRIYSFNGPETSPIIKSQNKENYRRKIRNLEKKLFNQIEDYDKDYTENINYFTHKRKDLKSKEDKSLDMKWGMRSHYGISSRNNTIDEYCNHTTNELERLVSGDIKLYIPRDRKSVV